MLGIHKLFHGSDFCSRSNNALCSGSIGITLRAPEVVAFVLPRQGWLATARTASQETNSETNVRDPDTKC